MSSGIGDGGRLQFDEDEKDDDGPIYMNYRTIPGEQLTARRCSPSPAPRLPLAPTALSHRFVSLPFLKQADRPPGSTVGDDMERNGSMQRFSFPQMQMQTRC
jgi:hypothetical protein